MLWQVANAVNRDVERQHLNKILKEIRQAVDSVDKKAVTETQVRSIVTTKAGGSGTSAPPAPPRPITISLTGDATGSGTGTDVINIPLTLAGDVVREAPATGIPYWRIDGGWEEIPFPLMSLLNQEATGFAAYDSETGEWITREIEVDTLDLAVDNSDGVEGNPTVSLAVVTAPAGETIHGGRAVILVGGEVFHPRTSDLSHALQVVGIADTSGEVGDEVRVKTTGKITDTSYSFSPGLVFCDDEGVLTQAPGSTGWTVAVGNVINSSTFQLNIMLPIIRN